MGCCSSQQAGGDKATTENDDDNSNKQNNKTMKLNSVVPMTTSNGGKSTTKYNKNSSEKAKRPNDIDNNNDVDDNSTSDGRKKKKKKKKYSNINTDGAEIDRLSRISRMTRSRRLRIQTQFETFWKHYTTKPSELAPLAEEYLDSDTEKENSSRDRNNNDDNNNNNNNNNNNKIINASQLSNDGRGDPQGSIGSDMQKATADHKKEEEEGQQDPSKQSVNTTDGDSNGVDHHIDVTNKSIIDRELENTVNDNNNNNNNNDNNNNNNNDNKKHTYAGDIRDTNATTKLAHSDMSKNQTISMRNTSTPLPTTNTTSTSKGDHAPNTATLLAESNHDDYKRHNSTPKADTKQPDPAQEEDKMMSFLKAAIKKANTTSTTNNNNNASTFTSIKDQKKTISGKYMTMKQVYALCEDTVRMRVAKRRRVMRAQNPQVPHRQVDKIILHEIPCGAGRKSFKNAIAALRVQLWQALDADSEGKITHKEFLTKFKLRHLPPLLEQYIVTFSPTLLMMLRRRRSSVFSFAGRKGERKKARPERVLSQNIQSGLDTFANSSRGKNAFGEYFENDDGVLPQGGSSAASDFADSENNSSSLASDVTSSSGYTCSESDDSNYDFDSADDDEDEFFSEDDFEDDE